MRFEIDTQLWKNILSLGHEFFPTLKFVASPSGVKFAGLTGAVGLHIMLSSKFFRNFEAKEEETFTSLKAIEALKHFKSPLITISTEGDEVVYRGLNEEYKEKKMDVDSVFPIQLEVSQFGVVPKKMLSNLKVAIKVPVSPLNELPSGEFYVYEMANNIFSVRKEEPTSKFVKVIPIQERAEAQNHILKFKGEYCEKIFKHLDGAVWLLMDDVGMAISQPGETSSITILLAGYQL